MSHYSHRAFAHQMETMTMLRHKSACIMSVLAVLMLSTACSTTKDIIITAPGDTTAPTDSTASPDDTTAPTNGTAAPGDDTPTGGGTTSPGDTPTPTDGTTAPGGDIGTTTTDTPETPVTVGDQGSADGQESAERAPVHI